MDRGERRRAVGVEHVVGGGERDGVGEVPRRLLEAAGREGRITFGLRLVGHGGRAVRSDRGRAGEASRRFGGWVEEDKSWG